MFNKVDCLSCKHFDFDIFEIDLNVADFIECAKDHEDIVSFDELVECEDFEEVINNA